MSWWRSPRMRKDVINARQCRAYGPAGRCQLEKGHDSSEDAPKGCYSRQHRHTGFVVNGGPFGAMRKGTVTWEVDE
jgi:hypothetical protein